MNYWLEQRRKKCETYFEIDFNTLNGDTLKERQEQVHFFVQDFYKKRKAFKIEANLESGSLFETSCQSFCSREELDIINGNSLGYQIKYGPAHGMNFWILPWMTSPLYIISTGLTSCPVKINIWLKNYS
jgi:hypothetical protein